MAGEAGAVHSISLILEPVLQRVIKVPEHCSSIPVTSIAVLYGFRHPTCKAGGMVVGVQERNKRRNDETGARDLRLCSRLDAGTRRACFPPSPVSHVLLTSTDVQPSSGLHKRIRKPGATDSCSSIGTCLLVLLPQPRRRARRLPS